MASIKLHDSGGNPVQKCTVMRDGDNAALEVDKQVFQPFDRVQIKVIGWLVKQQHVWLGNQGLSQSDSLLGAARQGVDRSATVQMEAMQRLGHPLLPVPSVISLNLALKGIQIALAGAILVDERDDPCQSRANCRKNTRFRVQHWFLRHIGQSKVLLILQCSIVRLLQASQNLEQR